MIALKAHVVDAVVNNASCAGRIQIQFLLAWQIAWTFFAKDVVANNVSCVGKMPRPLNHAVPNRS